MINFILNNYNSVLQIIGSVVSIATIIVKITPTTKDDTALNNINELVQKFSIVNTKTDQEIIDNNK